MKFALALTAVVASTALAQYEIVGGKEAEIGKHLYVVGWRDTPGSQTNCGGSLIAPNVVLTAAHCARKSREYVAIGTHYNTGTQDGEQIKVIQQIIHPKYNSRTDSHDYAILLLERDSKYAPVEVSFDEVGGNVTTITRGWGRTSERDPPSEVLLEVAVDTITNQRCRELYKPPRYAVDDSMLCAAADDKDSCKGDSGGPLTIETNGTVKLVGIVSWGEGCARKDFPGVYSRISYVREFIEPYLKPTTTTKAPPSSTKRPTPKPFPTRPPTAKPSTTKRFTSKPSVAKASTASPTIAPPTRKPASAKPSPSTTKRPTTKPFTAKPPTVKPPTPSPTLVPSTPKPTSAEPTSTPFTTCPPWPLPVAYKRHD